jgi:hypothetical protein
MRSKSPENAGVSDTLSLQIPLCNGVEWDKLSHIFFRGEVGAGLRSLAGS